MPAWDNGQGWVFPPAGARAPAQPTIKTGQSKKPGPEHINTTTGTATLVRTIRSHGVNDRAWSNDGATLYFADGNSMIRSPSGWFMGWKKITTRTVLASTARVRLSTE